MKAEEDLDVQLMLAVQRGQEAAFETLFRKYIGQLVGFATSFAVSRARAEELAQEVFVQVYQARDRYRPRARFSTWLFRIATNLCISEARRAEYRFRLRTMVPRRADQTAALEPEAAAYLNGRSSEDELLSREALAGVHSALSQLPPQQRAALLLARVEGFSYAEVAESLGCTIPAVKSLIHRATTTVRQSLSGIEGQ